jgi:hypothetical protein
LPNCDTFLLVLSYIQFFYRLFYLLKKQPDRMKKAVDVIVLKYVTHSLCLYYKYVAVFILICILIQY